MPCAKNSQPYGWPKEKSERKTLLVAGLNCGTFLFAPSAAQQIGITINSVHGQGRVPDGHVRCAGAGVRPLSGPEGQRSAAGSMVIAVAGPCICSA